MSIHPAGSTKSRRLQVVEGGARPSHDDLLTTAYAEHADYLAVLAFRILGRDADVEDVVQDTFVQLVRQLDRLDTTTSLRPWLATVAVRAAGKKLRRRRLLATLGMGGVTTTYDDIAEPGASPETRVLLGQVYQALDRVRPEERIAWSLRHLHGERLDAVARLCDCSLATAKRRIAAAQLVVQREVGE